MTAAFLVNYKTSRFTAISEDDIFTKFNKLRHGCDEPCRAV